MCKSDSLVIQIFIQPKIAIDNPNNYENLEWKNSSKKGIK